MTDIDVMVLAQAQAYQAATDRFGRGKEERHLIPSLAAGQEDTVANWGKGGYGTKAVMSYYTTLMKLAGGVPTGTAESKRRKPVAR